tara:strand:+ start:155 stop:1333 length:1179 start_codon:yes stop_codon:yes gene_type:complete
MSLQSSRYESQSIVNTFNLFVDSENSSAIGHGHSKGDDVHIHMEGNSIEAFDGEIIRLSLTNFTMFNNLYNVDNTNSRIRVRTNGPSNHTGNVEIFLSRKNYKTLNEIADEFAAVLGARLVIAAVDAGATAVSQFVPTGVLPSQTALGNTGERHFEFVLTAKNSSNVAINHNLFTDGTGVILQCERASGESYAILGGKRLDEVSTTFQSFEVTVAAQTVTVKGFFPMQRMSDPYVYVRCENVSNGLEMGVLDSAKGTPGPDVINSNILGKVFRDVEFISYHSQTGDEYFINLQQRRLSNLRLFLTDSKGRRLGRVTGSSSNTAAGRIGATEGSFASNDQALTGNLYFTAVIKIEVIRTRNPTGLQSAPPPSPQIARESQSVLIWPDYGRPKY